MSTNRTSTGMERKGHAGLAGASVREHISIATRELGDDGFAKESWWIGLSREAFREKQAQEQARLSTSRFGKASALSIGNSEKDWVGSAPRKVDATFTPPERQYPRAM